MIAFNKNFLSDIEEENEMKKAVSLLLALSLVAAAAAGCGGKEPATGGSTNQEAGGSSDAATFKIGAIGPVTGGAAIYGEAVRNGAELAVKEINEAGGINGYQVEYQFADDEGDAEKSINAYNSLKDWGMQMLVGTTTSTPCIAVAAETAADNMFQITPSGSAEDCIAEPNAFRVCFSDPEQGTKSAMYIGENGLAEKVAIIYDSSEVYSTGIYEKFVEEAANQPFEIVAAEAFTADSNKDFTVQVQKAKDKGADLVFLPIYYEQVALILDQANKAGYTPKFFGCDGVDGLLSQKGFDTKLAEGVMLLTSFVADEDTELTKNFVESYEEAYGGTPIQFAAGAYDAVYAVKAAAEKANVTPDMSASDICEALKTAMTEITLEGLTGTITWTEDGAPEKAPKAMRIENGVYTVM